MEKEQKHVVVLGAGFGGLTFCQHFKNPNARITLVDRTNHHLFQPLLYQVATAGLSAPDIAQPIRAILSKQKNVTVLMDCVEGIDLAKRTVQLSESSLTYDFLVITLGSGNSYFGHPEWEQFAPGLKTLKDAANIRTQVLLAFERAENTDDVDERTRLMTVVVVGGGPPAWNSPALLPNSRAPCSGEISAASTPHRPASSSWKARHTSSPIFRPTLLRAPRAS